MKNGRPGSRPGVFRVWPAVAGAVMSHPADHSHRAAGCCTPGSVPAVAPVRCAGSRRRSSPAVGSRRGCERLRRRAAHRWAPGCRSAGKESGSRGRLGIYNGSLVHLA